MRLKVKVMSEKTMTVFNFSDYKGLPKANTKIHIPKVKPPRERGMSSKIDYYEKGIMHGNNHAIDNAIEIITQEASFFNEEGSVMVQGIISKLKGQIDE